MCRFIYRYLESIIKIESLLVISIGYKNRTLFSNDLLSSPLLTSIEDKRAEIVNRDLVGSIEREITDNKFFGNYTDLILRARSTEAFEKTCNIFTLISTNLLHFYLKHASLKLELYHPHEAWNHDDRGFSEIKSFVFSDLTEKAKNELIRRENPPYDPLVFLEENAWKEVF